VLVHYEEWNHLFREMYSGGVNRTNDRLIRSLVSSNKDIIYRELKDKQKIYIKDGIMCMGIMDEFGVLEYGEAFCQIDYKDEKKILSGDFPTVKCPCHHPGDVRLLNYKKYIEGCPETEKYKVFERFKNCLIFPQKGRRPHPNEIAGSDLDGDCYYVFYDKDFCNIKQDDPMDYTDDTPPKVKDKVSLKDVVEYYSNFLNSNNLGLIANAHLAQCDFRGPKHEISISIAKKFALAVDAPKTGARIVLEENEKMTQVPHYLGGKSTYHSESIIGQLYDKTIDYIKALDYWQYQRFSHQNH
jgi:RNA-dependent RNA polymerase